jgi:hypothetical protein
MPRQNHLVHALNGNEAPRIADLFAVTLLLLPSLFAAYKTPNFVGLYVLYMDAMNRRFKEPLTILPSRNHRVKDRVAVDFGKPLDRADGDAF